MKTTTLELIKTAENLESEARRLRKLAGDEEECLEIYGLDGKYLNMKLKMDDMVDKLLALGWKWDPEFDECRKLNPHLMREHKWGLRSFLIKLNISFDPRENEVSVGMHKEHWSLLGLFDGFVEVSFKDEDLDFNRFIITVIEGLPKRGSSKIYESVLKELIYGRLLLLL